MGTESELVRLIFIRKTGWPRQKAAGVKLLGEPQGARRDTKEKRKGHCGPTPLTSPSCLASLRWASRQSLVSLSADAQQRHEEVKIAVHFCGDGCAITG